MKPKFIHDCDKCQFLGRLFVPINNCMADLYKACDSTENDAYLIFRYSDDGADYSHVNTKRTAYLFNPA
jgi:hypothetical protein